MEERQLQEDAALLLAGHRAAEPTPGGLVPP